MVSMDFRANEYNQTSSLSNKQQRFLRSHKGPRGVHSSPFPEFRQVCPFFLCYFADHQRSPSRDEGLRRLRPEFRTWSTEESFLNYVFSLCNYIELLVFSLSYSFVAVPPFYLVYFQEGHALLHERHQDDLTRWVGWWREM